MLRASHMSMRDRTDSELFADILVYTLLVLTPLSLAAGVLVGLVASEDGALVGGIIAGFVAAFYCLLTATILGLLRDIWREVRRGPR